MTVATWAQTYNQNQLGGNYVAQVDNNFSVHLQIAGAFAPHEARTIITGYASGATGGVGSYSVNIAQAVGSSAAPVTLTLGNSGAAVVTGYISGNTLTVTSVTSGTVLVGQYVSGSTTLVPNMTVVIDPGTFMSGGALVAPRQQTSGPIVAPAPGYTRIDRICINQITGVYDYVGGAATTGTPTAPAIPEGYNPCCQILLSNSTTAITNGGFKDEVQF